MQIEMIKTVGRWYVRILGSALLICAALVLVFGEQNGLLAVASLGFSGLYWIWLVRK